MSWIITDPAGLPLNVGREQRTVTPGQWAALIVRDGGGCAFPGCTRTAEWCEAHHIQWWRHGGPTDLPNLVLLCAHHHRAIHHHGWDIALAADGIPNSSHPPGSTRHKHPEDTRHPATTKNRSP